MNGNKLALIPHLYEILSSRLKNGLGYVNCIGSVLHTRLPYSKYVIGIFNLVLFRRVSVTWGLLYRPYSWPEPKPRDLYIALVWWKYGLFYRGPGFLAVVWFGSSPTPLPHTFPSVSSTGDTHKREKERQVADGRGRARSRIIRPQEAWSSICHSILSVLMFIGGSTTQKIRFDRLVPLVKQFQVLYRCHSKAQFNEVLFSN